MSLGNLARVIAVSTACVAAIGSATSTTNNPQPPNAAPQAANSPPPPQPMEASRALGLWRSTFGAVKIEADNSKGGLASGSLQGVWVYQRRGEEVVGYFGGTLRGNVFQFRWQEPNNPPLTGEGYLVFEQSGRQYNGRWWSDGKERVGDWNGWRQASPATPMPNGQPTGQPYGGQGYGTPAPDPYGQPQGSYGGQGYGTPQPYAPQPYAPQPQPQPQPAQQRYPQPQPQPYGPAQPSPYGQPQPQPQPRPYY